MSASRKSDRHRLDHLDQAVMLQPFFETGTEVLFAGLDDEALLTQANNYLMSQLDSGSDRKKQGYVGRIEYPRRHDEIGTPEGPRHLQLWQDLTVEWLQQTHGAALRKTVLSGDKTELVTILFLVLGGKDKNGTEIPPERIHPGEAAKQAARQSGKSDSLCKAARRDAFEAYKISYAKAVADLNLDHLRQSPKNEPTLGKYDRGVEARKFFQRFKSRSASQEPGNSSGGSPDN